MSIDTRGKLFENPKIKLKDTSLKGQNVKPNSGKESDICL